MPTVMPVLSDDQLRVIRALEWVLSPEPRAAGRTTALAVGIIRAAAANPGNPIPVRDHFHAHDRQLLLVLQEFLQADPLIHESYHLAWTRHPELTIELVQPIRRWLPMGWTEAPRPGRVEDAQRCAVPARATLSLWDHLLADDS